MNASGLRPVGVGANCGKHRFWFGLKIEVPVPTNGGIAVSGFEELVNAQCSPAGAWARAGGRANNTMLPKRNMVSSFRIWFTFKSRAHQRSREGPVRRTGIRARFNCRHLPAC